MEGKREKFASPRWLSEPLPAPRPSERWLSWPMELELELEAILIAAAMPSGGAIPPRLSGREPPADR